MDSLLQNKPNKVERVTSLQRLGKFFQSKFTPAGILKSFQEPSTRAYRNFYISLYKGLLSNKDAATGYLNARIAALSTLAVVFVGAQVAVSSVRNNQLRQEKLRDEFLEKKAAEQFKNLAK